MRAPATTSSTPRPRAATRSAAAPATTSSTPAPATASPTTASGCSDDAPPPRLGRALRAGVPARYRRHAGRRAEVATYAQTVAAAPGLAAYWRLGEAPGAATAADAAQAWPGTYAAATLGAPGALSGDADTAARLAGAGSISAGNGPALAGS